jgi:hypothetical protein
MLVDDGLIDEYVASPVVFLGKHIELTERQERYKELCLQHALPLGILDKLVPQYEHHILLRVLPLWVLANNLDAYHDHAGINNSSVGD